VCSSDLVAARAWRKADASGAERDVLAEEQAALRRVATLVAHGADPAEVHAAVAGELGHLLGVESVTIDRAEPNGASIAVAAWTANGAARAHAASAVTSPIIVDGERWGSASAYVSQPESLPVDAEARIAEFACLVAVSISNAEYRAEVAASRARIVAAADDARRRLERDLHDGVQQRLVALALEVRSAQAALRSQSDELQRFLSRMSQGLSSSLDELRRISRGIHPAILSEGGLNPALKSLARRSNVPVELDVRLGPRLPEHVEVAAYYVASEALTNATKHAHASTVQLRIESAGDVVVMSIRDDGIGGADPGRGSGLIGLTDRVAAIGGAISVISPPGGGTFIHVTLPLSSPAHDGIGGADSSSGMPTVGA